MQGAKQIWEAIRWQRLECKRAEKEKEKRRRRRREGYECLYIALLLEESRRVRAERLEVMSVFLKLKL